MIPLKIIFRSDLNMIFGETEGHSKRGFSGLSARNEACPGQTNIRINSHKQIWHERMSEYIRIRKIDTNECKNKYLHIWIFSSHSGLECWNKQDVAKFFPLIPTFSYRLGEVRFWCCQFCTWYNFLLAPKELYTWYCPMTIRWHPLFEHTPVLNDNLEYWCHDDFVDCDFYED